jgi:hypothetical protein
MRHNYRRRELQAADAVERSYEVQTDMENNYLLSYLESNPVPNTIRPGPLLTSLFVCAKCEYYEALSIQRHSTKSFIQKNKTTTPKRNRPQLTRITGHVVHHTKHEKFVCGM